MYQEKLKPLLNDIDDINIVFAGGSVVGQVLSITCSLIIYICNLTIGKKKYLEVEETVKQIKTEAEENKKKALEIIDKDKEILEDLLFAFKNRKENPKELEINYKKSTDFCMEVTRLSFNVLNLSQKISKVGNKMLSSDFKITCNYAFSSVESSIVNVKINLNSLEDVNYKEKIQNECETILNEAKDIKNRVNLEN